MRLRAASISRKGPESTCNEDALLVDTVNGLFAVADGIGGSSNGEIASRTSIVCLRSAWANRADAGAGDGVLAVLQAAFAGANSAIIASARQSNLTMGTTLTAVVIQSGMLYLAHCGDSRAYLFTQSATRRLTEDQTLVADMARRGFLTADDALQHPKRNVLTGCLGRHENFRLQTGTCVFGAGQTLLLCTDGVFSVIDDADIARCVKRSHGLDRLIDAALKAGSQDDMTAVIVSAEGDLP